MGASKRVNVGDRRALGVSTERLAERYAWAALPLKE